MAGIAWVPIYRSQRLAQPPRQKCPAHALWIVAEDKLSGQRVLLAQFDGQLSIMYQKMDENGLCYGETRHIHCKGQKHMAQEIDALFARAHKAA